ncbi:MAG: molybdopterin molybdotransferase MoeA [Taibaiella sp.]|nr:molybdopterin molybdotransferase MoeA [Taibaiella sp.]
MIKVQEAENIIQREAVDYGMEEVAIPHAKGRILATDIICDRDQPPYDRVTMDGIAISFSAWRAGNRKFTVKATQAAGGKPICLDTEDECIEIMTGCALHETADTIVRYEDLKIENNIATVQTELVKQGQNIHRKGKDKPNGAVAVPANTVIDAAVINIAATVGAAMLRVKRLPTVIIVSTGDELRDIDAIPEPQQIRRSNSYTIQAILREYNIQAQLLHIPDNEADTAEQLGACIQGYDVVILSGGVSMGKFDYVPAALEQLGVTKLFHKVRQRPGKPFWFGKHAKGTLVFAFPGNPVSAFMCMHRYFLPWLETSAGLHCRPVNAVLGADASFEPDLQYFMQVTVFVDDAGQLIAMPVEGNGSGDLSNLLTTNAFMELPAEKTHFYKGETYRIWAFKRII